MEQVRIGKFIQTLRKEMNLTQKELADQLGVTDRAISKWENGRGMPEVSSMKALCDTLGITVNELLSGERIDQKDYREKSEMNFLTAMDASDRKMKKKDSLLWAVTVGAMLLVLTLILWIYTLPVGYFRAEEEIGISLILKTDAFSDSGIQDITENIDRKRLEQLLPLMQVTLGTEPATYWEDGVAYQIFGYFKSGPRAGKTFLVYLGDWNCLVPGSAERGHRIINPETWLEILEWLKD